MLTRDGTRHGRSARLAGVVRQARRAGSKGLSRRLLAEGLAGWREEYPDVVLTRLVVRDRPADVLVEQSGRAQLPVVGSHGRGGAAGLVLGSVSHAVAHRAECPVAIVRGTASADGR